MRSALRGSLLFLALASSVLRVLGAQDVALDTIRAGRFDSGKMWTFEYAPQKFFSETYGFDANAQWFEKARLAALRIPGCSAAFVSANGLAVTNHHCVRDNVVKVTRTGENLLENGFYATTLAQERRITNFHADQLIAAHDVSDEVFAATDRATTDADRQRARNTAISAIRDRLRQQHAATGDSIFVQVVSLYAGGRYSAYVFRRYTDVRLVLAAEHGIAFFGGDSDNFTYPRYDLDFAFLRVYGLDGKPVSSPSHFKWSTTGIAENDVVFVIGNPGPTTRMNAVAQLEFIRDVQLPAEIGVQQGRWDALNAELLANPQSPDAGAIRVEMLSLSNRLKAAHGRLAALNDPAIIARRLDAERQFARTVEADPTLKAKYGDVLEQLGGIQRRKREFAGVFGAAYQFGLRAAAPALVRRAHLLHELRRAATTGISEDSIRALRDSVTATASRTAPVERARLGALLQQWSAYLPANDTVLRVALRGRSVAEATAALLSASTLTDSARAAEATKSSQITLDDPALDVVAAYLASTAAYQGAWPTLLAEEREGNARLGRARFEIYGTTVPPDATSSPRITDGVVKRYEFNGTFAPPYTTFYGMYDRHYAFGPGTEWDLPKRWLPAPRALDLNTPLNFISTADTYGGNSGSPAVTKRLEIVGLNFDRNINGLSRDYVYLPERGRNVMVDVRAIAESLASVYGAQRILQELRAR